MYHCEGCGHEQGHWEAYCPACGGDVWLRLVYVSFDGDLEAGEVADRVDDSRAEETGG